jgi:hypothetical protein
MVANELRVGDSAWFPRVGTEQVKRTCIVCFGKLAVVVVLGDGSEVQTPCDYCGKGFGGPKGWTIEYEAVHFAELVTVTKVIAEDAATGRTVEYETTPYTHAKPGDLFATEAECAAVVARLVAAHADYEDKNRKPKRMAAAAKHTWNVGYHMRQATEMRRSIVYHEERAIVLKARNKTGSAPPKEQP